MEAHDRAAARRTPAAGRHEVHLEPRRCNDAVDDREWRRSARAGRHDRFFDNTHGRNQYGLTDVHGAVHGEPCHPQTLAFAYQGHCVVQGSNAFSATVVDSYESGVPCCAADVC